MSNLNKHEIFCECGFEHLPEMPHISFGGYDKVMNYCYKQGYTDAITGFKLPEFDKYTKDLETANARLLERNHELQVDNEASLKEVENQYKIVAALRDDKTQLLERFDEHVEMITELRQENLEYSKRCDELRKYNTELARSTLKQDIESVPKSKFVITVEEF